MFRITQSFTRHLSSHATPNRCLLFSARPTEQGNKINLLLNLADEFMLKGKVHSSEDIYKSIIEKYPHHQTAYEKLWESWLVHRSLKVTKRELDYFMERYQAYIKPNADTSLRPK